MSNYDKNNVNSPTIADCNSPRVKEGTLDENSKNTPNTEGLTTATEGHLSTIFPNRAGSWNAQMALYNGKNPCVFLRGADTEWAKWLALATKSDLIQDGIYDVTTDSNGAVAINNIVSGVTVDRFAGAYLYSEAVDANILTHIHLYKKYVFAIAINPDTNAKYANRTMKMRVWYRKS